MRHRRDTQADDNPLSNACPGTASEGAHRREFLKGAGAVALGTLAAGCGRKKGKGLPMLSRRNGEGERHGTPIHVEHAAGLGLGEAAFDRIKLTMKKLG